MGRRRSEITVLLMDSNSVMTPETLELLKKISDNTIIEKLFQRNNELLEKFEITQPQIL